MDYNIFQGTNKGKNLTKYTLLRGVPDFSNTEQFALYEGGYSIFVLCSIPKFMEELKTRNEDYANLVDNFCHILEYEFKGMDGLEDITGETQELTNNISNLAIITKVNKQSASTFSLRYQEKAGAILAKFTELYLTGIKDPRTQVKTYHGLIKDGVLEGGFENEVFSFMNIVTDNTMTKIEKAVYVVSAQINKAPQDLFNVEKGDIGFKEVSIEFNGYPLTGIDVTAKAREFLDEINAATEYDSERFKYSGLSTVEMYKKPSDTVATGTTVTL